MHLRILAVVVNCALYLPTIHIGIQHSLEKSRIKATTEIWTICCTNGSTKWEEQVQTISPKRVKYLTSLKHHKKDGCGWKRTNILVTRFPTTIKSPVPAGRCQICILYVCSSLVFKIYWYWNVKSASFQFWVVVFVLCCTFWGWRAHNIFLSNSVSKVGSVHRKLIIFWPV